MLIDPCDQLAATHDCLALKLQHRTPTAEGIDAASAPRPSGGEPAGAIVEEVTLPDFALYNGGGRIILLAEALFTHQKDLSKRPL